MRLLLDTAPLIYAVQFPERLSKRAAVALQNLDNSLELSTISISEIAIKAFSGRLEFSASTLRQAIEDLGLRLLPYTSEHAFRLFELPGHHRDPFDRQIIAQALSEGIPVMTSDQQFGQYQGLKILW